jgi:hypothetical protein
MTCVCAVAVGLPPFAISWKNWLAGKRAKPFDLYSTKNGMHLFPAIERHDGLVVVLRVGRVGGG